MKRYPSIIAAGLMLVAITTLPAPAAANTWNNFTANSLWSTNAPDQNWTSPTSWVNGDDAIFGPSGVGTVYLYTPVSAHNIMFDSAGYSINAFGGGNTLTLAGTTPTISNNVNVTIAATIVGTNGMACEGSGSRVLQGDVVAGLANAYTNGTYVRNGTLVLQCTNALYPGNSSSGVSYAVDSIEALDTGATIKLGTIDDGLGHWYWVPKGQIAAGAPNFVSRLHLTGGTFDFNGDQRGNNQVPCPDGFGTIINTSSNIASGMIIVGDGQDHTFAGHIMDGGLVTTNVLYGSTNWPGYQIGILDLHYGAGGYTLTLSGSNSFSGSIRCGNASIKLSGAGTLGWPSPFYGITGPMRISGGQHIDLNGTSQTIGPMGNSGTGTQGTIYNSAVGTVSTLTFGVGDNDNFTAINFIDNPGTGGVLALTKVGTNVFGQGLIGTNTYSGDTTVSNGILAFLGTSAVSPNTNIRLYTGGGLLDLSYDGTANVQGLYTNGVPLCPGVYSSANLPNYFVDDIGLLQVTGVNRHLSYARSGNNITFSWLGNCTKLQAQTNSITGNWSDYPGGGSSPVSVTNNPANGSVFYRLSPLP